ncbi:MAG TPA: DUF2264 domain-containing protein [Candidatus Limnocylindrales bacterium]|nr:DUF2264 domain-containing protein [Candidatus Limnocylindrales bacterium]
MALLVEPDRASPAVPTWTRDDWARVLARLTVGFDRAAAASGSPARPLLAGDVPGDVVSGLEAFARMSVAWGAWLGGPNPSALVHAGRKVDVLELVVRGLVDGTTAGGRFGWGPIDDRDQRIVEDAELATGLWLGRERLVPALGGERLHTVLGWLAGVDGRDLYPDNWLLFPVVVAAVRRALGEHVADEAIDAGLDEVLGWHVGDGWYADGDGPALDWYTGWAIHWHLLLWAAIDGARRPRARSLVRRRARRWLADAVHLFDADGSYVRWGRSLAYRFASVAPFGLAEALGVSPLPPGLARTIGSRGIARALDDGAFDPGTDWLTRGVTGERPGVLEGYISRGSPAWAAHAFVPLVLGSEHPFWRAPEVPLPVERGHGSLALRGPAMLVTWSPAAGVRLLSARSGHADDIPGHDYATGYGKLAYRSRFPFTVEGRDGSYAPDDTVILVAADGRTGHRGRTEAGDVTRARARSRSIVAIGDVRHELTTVVVPDGDVDVRVTLVAPGAPVRAVEGAPALGATEATAIERTVSTSDGWAAARCGDRMVAIRALAGYDEVRPSGSSSATAGRNLVWPHAEQPAVAESLPSDRARVVASAVLARSEPFDPEVELRPYAVDVAGNLRSARVRLRDRTVRVRLS